MGQTEIPGHVAADQLAAEEDAVAVDGIPSPPVPQGQLHGVVLARGVPIVVPLSGDFIFRAITI